MAASSNSGIAKNAAAILVAASFFGDAMDTLSPQGAKNAGLSQEDVEPKTPPRGNAGDDAEAAVDDLVNDIADTSNDVKESGESGTSF